MIEETEAVVKLQGSPSLRDTHEIRQRLMEALEAGNPVVLDVRDLAEVDISILQLLIAARISAMHRGVELRLIAASEGIFQDALERFGLLEMQQ
ncbi:STAS domain-containing protein [Billgrantia sp. Q4P2]|uniref:STAS domain-containing protein n=1 Tax=Billgrantia sp. Q4P2 TaxID=3463857 RepID=UPI004056DF87